MFKNFFSENRAVYKKMWWKNIVEADRPQMTIRRKYTACLITKTTNTYTNKMCNALCSSTDVKVTLTRFSVTFIHTVCLSVVLPLP
jgi:hypothetical protein